MAVRMVCARSTAEMPVVTPSRASMDSVNAVPKREVFCWVMGKRRRVFGALLGEGEADEAAAVAGHEVDGLGGDVLGGQGEVALVLAVFVVDHDNHAARAEIGYGAGNVGEGGLGSARRLGHIRSDAALFSLIRGGNARKAGAAI